MVYELQETNKISNNLLMKFVFEQANKTQMYDDFDMVISELNRDRTSHIYTIIN